MANHKINVHFGEQKIKIVNRWEEDWISENPDVHKLVTHPTAS